MNNNWALFTHGTHICTNIAPPVGPAMGGEWQMWINVLLKDVSAKMSSEPLTLGFTVEWVNHYTMTPQLK